MCIRDRPWSASSRGCRPMCPSSWPRSSATWSAGAPALQVALDLGQLDGHIGRQPLEDADQGRAVGLASGEIAQGHGARTVPQAPLSGRCGLLADLLTLAQRELLLTEEERAALAGERQHPEGVGEGIALTRLETVAVDDDLGRKGLLTLAEDVAQADGRGADRG